MFRFAADGCLAVLNAPFPVKCIFACLGQAPGPTRNPKVNAGKMLVFLDFCPFLYPQIPGISIYRFIIFSNQTGSLRSVVPVCRDNRNRMNQAAAGICPNMAFHAETPLISFLHLVHFRVTRFIRVLCGARRVNDRGILS